MIIVQEKVIQKYICFEMNYFFIFLVSSLFYSYNYVQGFYDQLIQFANRLCKLKNFIVVIIEKIDIEQKILYPYNIYHNRMLSIQSFFISNQLFLFYCDLSPIFLSQSFPPSVIKKLQGSSFK
ncbi:hypothetical protein pb186bvf_017492 [Paramecium bursaria]